MKMARLLSVSLMAFVIWQAIDLRAAGVETKPATDTPPSRPRVAVINKVKGSPLGDLLFDFLSRSGGFDLVERDRIDLILKEQAATALSREGNIKLGRMLKADALLFVELIENFLHVSLVETGRGERLLDNVSRLSEDTLEGGLKTVPDQILALKAKLDVPVEKRRYIAMLPFAQEGEQPKWDALRPLSVLVESRLISFPTVVVVEREHITTLLQEVNLAKEDVSNFSHADYIVRSSFTFSSADRGALTIQIRSSVSRDDVSSRTFELSKDDPCSSVEGIAAWIATTAGDGTPVRDRAPDEAAAHYANAQVFKARGRPDPFRSLEMAYLLQPTNLTYAAAYAEALSQRWDQVPTFSRRFDYLNLAIDAYMKADPKRAKPPMPTPSFMASIPKTVKSVGHRIAVLPFGERPGAAYKGEGLRGSRVLRKYLEQWPSLHILPETLTVETMEEMGIDLSNSISTGALGELAKQLEIEAAVSIRIGGTDAPKLTVMSVTPTTWRAMGVEGRPGEDVECLAERVGEQLVRHFLVTSDMITPAEHEAFLHCRKRLEDYYRWYCNYDKGIPLIKKRQLFVSLCPLFCESPEKAAVELKKVALMDRFDGSVLENHMFLSMATWDPAQAKAAWVKVLRDIATESPSPLLQLQARRALWRVDRSKEEALNLLAWAVKETTNLVCFAAKIPGNDPMWDDVFAIDQQKQVMDFDAWILPVVMVKYPAAQGPRVVDLLAGWLANNADNMVEAKRTAILLEKALVASKEGDARAYTNLLAHIRDRQPSLIPLVVSHAIPAKVMPVAQAVPPPKVPPPPPPPFTPPEGGTLVFEYSKDVPEALKDNMPEFQGMCFMGEGDRAWLAWPSQEFHPPRFTRQQIMVAEMDAANKSCRVHGLRLDGSAINYNGASIFRWDDKICIGDLTHFFIASLNKGDGSLCTNNMVQITGFPPRGQGENRMSFFTVAGDYLYMVAEPTLYFGHYSAPSYSGIFRLKRGMDKVEKVCASDSIEAGPLNDCAPYHVCGIDVADDGNTLFFNLNYGPKSGWWKYEPARNKWIHVGNHVAKALVADKRWQVFNVTGPRVYWVPGAK